MLIELLLLARNKTTTGQKKGKRKKSHHPRQKNFHVVNLKRRITPFKIVPIHISQHTIQLLTTSPNIANTITRIAISSTQKVQKNKSYIHKINTTLVDAITKKEIQLPLSNIYTADDTHKYK